MTPLVSMNTMRFGTYMRNLSGRRRIVIAAFLVGLIAAVYSVDHISLFPPRLTPKDVSIATAHTSLVVDTPDSVVLDLRQDTSSFTGLQNRAILLGNVIAGGPVLDYMAAQVHVPDTDIQVLAPATPDQPLPRVIVGHDRSVKDIFRYANQYRVSVEASPTAPMLDIYTEAPTVTAAVALANGAVDGLNRYMATLAAERKVSGKDQIRLTQLGRAEGAVTNPGANWQLALLAFLAGFWIAVGAFTVLGRVRRGWIAGAPVASVDA
jgi:hypothetical protein